MKIRKSLAGIAAGSLALAGLAVAVAPAAQAATGGPYTLTGSPVNQAGTASYVGTPTVTLTAVQTPGSTDVTVSAAISEGPTTTSFAGFADGAYRLDAYVRIDGGPQVQLTGQVGVGAVPPSTVSYPLGTTASSLITGLANGPHSIVLQSLVLDSSGGLSGAFATQFSELQGFDAVYNFGATTAAVVLNPPSSPIGLTQAITVAGPSATIVSSSNQITGVTGYVRGGTGVTATLSGANWPTGQAAGTFTTEFCDTTGAGCDAAVTNTLSTNGSGALSGTVSIPGATTSGLRAIKITNGASSSLTNVTVLGTRSLTLSPASGGPGTVVTISGSDWNPSATIVKFAAINNTGFYGLASGINGGCTGFNTPTVGCIAVGPNIPGPNNAMTVTTVSATGTLSGTVTVVDSATTQVEVAEKSIVSGAPANTNADLTSLSQGGSKLSPFTVNQDQCTADNGNVNTGSCSTKQNAYATVAAGNLAQQATAAAGNPDATTVVFCKTAAPATPPGGTQPGNTTNCQLTSQVTDTPMFASLNPVTVTDARGGNFGWSLTATMPNLSDGTHSISNSRVSISPSCASVNANSAPGITCGTASQDFGQAAPGVTLMIKDTQVAPAPGSQTSGGQWQVSAPLQLNVPAFQAAGQYNSTITVLLT